MISREQLGWLVGLIDGEGCIGVLRSERKGGWVYTIVVTIANTSPWNITTAEKLLRELDLTPNIYNSTANDLTRNPGYQLRLGAKMEVLALLETILPYLAGKRDEADVALWYLRRACGTEHHKITSHERRALDAIGQIKRSAGVASPALREKLNKIGVVFTRSESAPQITLLSGGMRRRRITLELNGERLHISEWVKRTGLSLATIYRRKKAGLSDADCLKNGG